MEMLRLVNNFVQDLRCYTDGTSHHAKLMQDVNQAYARFKGEIWTTAPRFTPFTQDEIAEDEDRSLAGVDFMGHIKEIKDEETTPGGMRHKVMGLDSVRTHIKMYESVPSERCMS